ncbi:MAG: methyltransferase type 11 [Nanoarchaeota archaeon]|nr:methyltransferase type 11 [Nanoarchaeota archaeon]|tara:strand:- start:1628 stop:2275 length:648 start_codon:yes stop_codon:yes gene_type:complete
MAQTPVSKKGFYDESKKNYSYHNNYDKKIRWIQYHHQIDQVLKLSPKKVLEIGIGNKVVSDYLSKYVNIKKFDINSNLSPNVVGSVENLSNHFKTNSFDVVLCSQVLEHLPFEKFDLCLKQIRDVSKKYVILSLPHAAIHIRGNISVLKNFNLKLNLTIPRPIKHKFYLGHYWEIGKANYSKKLIHKHLRKYFDIKSEYGMPEDPYYRFYILEKK